MNFCVGERPWRFPASSKSRWMHAPCRGHDPWSSFEVAAEFDRHRHRANLRWDLRCDSYPKHTPRRNQPRLRSVTTPPATRTMSFGFAPKLSFHVPAAAHTSSYCNRSGSTNTRNCFVWPKGGTPPLALETHRDRVDQRTLRRSISGIPGLVSLIAQLIMTSGEIRNRRDPSSSSTTAVPMTLTPRGDQGSTVARSSTTTDT